MKNVINKMKSNYNNKDDGKAFEFTSIFKYSTVPTSDLYNNHLYNNDCNGYNSCNELNYNEKSFSQTYLYYGITFMFYLFLLLTFPFSIWFCIKKINSLQRCIIFRLGQRLPVKGPGFVIKFPLIDSIEIVDLSDHVVEIADRKQELLTSDGSIIQLTYLTAKLNVTNAIKSTTQLKDAKFNSEQFVKLAFLNMIASTHVEDLENKLDLVLSQFEENCNIYLNNWGWEIKITQTPKLVILSRADPVNPVMTKLKGLFNGGNTSKTTNMFNQLFNIDKSDNGLIKDQSTNQGSPQLINLIESMANKYSSFINYDIYIQIEIKEIDLVEYFKFCYQSGNVLKIEQKPSKIHIAVTANLFEDLVDFCQNENVTKVKINTSLD